MDAARELVKATLIPGSVSFLLLGLAIGVGLLFLRGRARAWGRIWLTALVALYYALSTPWVAGGLEAGLADGYGGLRSAAEARGATMVVVLGGGSETYRAGGRSLDVLSDASALRALEAVRVWRMLPGASLITSGGPGGADGRGSPESAALKAALVALGVPAASIEEEPRSSDTHDQALELAAMLRGDPTRRFVLITSPIHMRRALGAMRAQGLEPIPSASARRSEGAGPQPDGFLPSMEALGESTSALREALALIFYWARGWLGPTAP